MKVISGAKKMKEKQSYFNIFHCIRWREGAPWSDQKDQKPTQIMPLRAICKELTMDYKHKKNVQFDIDVSLYYMNLLLSSLPWTSTLFMILLTCSVIQCRLWSCVLIDFSVQIASRMMVMCIVSYCCKTVPGIELQIRRTSAGIVGYWRS